MAIVYLAQDLKHRRQVAIKVLRPELAAALGRERFLREGDTTEVRHFGDLGMADSANDLAGYLQWQMAYTLRDTAALTAIRPRFDRLNDASLWAITFRSQETGAALDDARDAVGVLVKRADSDSARGFPIRQQYRLAMNGGRPREAQGYWSKASGCTTS
ncbi:MAG: hypothetical protein ACREOQ_05715 [Gemmatimonadales bacterium]